MRVGGAHQACHINQMSQTLCPLHHSTWITSVRVSRARQVPQERVNCPLRLNPSILDEAVEESLYRGDFETSFLLLLLEFRTDLQALFRRLYLYCPNCLCHHQLPTLLLHLLSRRSERKPTGVVCIMSILVGRHKIQMNSLPWRMYQKFGMTAIWMTNLLLLTVKSLRGLLLWRTRARSMLWTGRRIARPRRARPIRRGSSMRWSMRLISIAMSSSGSICRRSSIDLTSHHRSQSQSTISRHRIQGGSKPRWQTSVPIPIPDGKKCTTWDGLEQFVIKKLRIAPDPSYHQEAFEDEDAAKYHFTPYREFYQPSPDVPPQRVFGEAYTTDEWIKAHEEINTLPREQDDNYECVVVGLMLWSDSTRLAQFGSASLWPLYLYFGNQSKYARACPTAHACHHVAYLPKVSLHSFL